MKILRKTRFALLGLGLAFMFVGSFPNEAVAGPGDGKGKQYWKCRWVIACDNSHQYSCSTSDGSCGDELF